MYIEHDYRTAISDFVVFWNFEIRKEIKNVRIPKFSKNIFEFSKKEYRTKCQVDILKSAESCGFDCEKGHF